MIYSPRPKCKDPIYDDGPSFVYDYIPRTLKDIQQKESVHV